MDASLSHQLPSRRRFLQASFTGTACGLFASALQLWTPSLLWSQSTATPDAALTQLMDGNKRFMAGRLTAHEQDLAILKQSTVEKQEPFAAVLSCADSRVPVELVFDQSIGHVFVTRVAGNVVTPEIIGSLEYGAAPGHQADPGHGTLGLWSGQGQHSGQGSSRADQRAVSAHSTGSRSRWIEPGIRDQGRCKNPGIVVT